jgi:hypothetical protein
MPEIIDTTWQLIGYSVAGLAVMLIVFLVTTFVVGLIFSLFRNFAGG